MKFFKNNFVVKFVVTLFLISIIFGLLFFFAYKPDLNAHIEDFKSLVTTSRQNVFLLNLGLISLIFILSISIVGLPGIIFYLFYEGFSIGFTLGLFLMSFKIKGLLFYLIFIISSKLIYLVVMLYFSVMCIRFIWEILEALVYKNKENLYKNIIYHFYRFVIILFILIINSIFIFLFSNNILKLVLGLI